jgi:hypothetical protein
LAHFSTDSFVLGLPRTITIFLSAPKKKQRFVYFASSLAEMAKLSICTSTVPRQVIASREVRLITCDQTWLIGDQGHSSCFFIRAFNQPDHRKETGMTLTQTQPRRRHHSSHASKVKVRPLTNRPSVVPEATVKEMLRDIAFVLHVTHRLSSEIKATKTTAEAIKG